MHLPKVLIYGQPFNDVTGGGITLSNLFADWDKNRLAVTCVPHLLHAVNEKHCNNYYQLGAREHKWIFPFNFIQKKFRSGPITVSSVTAGAPVKNKFRQALVDQFFYPLLMRLGLFHSVSAIRPSEQFYNWVDEFKPDILYIQVSTRKDFYFTRALHQHLKVPLVIHVMDDWPSTISSKGLFKKYWFKKIDAEFRSLLNRASLLMTISDQMTKEYRRRYHKDFIAFHNPVDISVWKKHQRSEVHLKPVPSFLYAGRIGISIDDSLKAVAKAIQSVSDELQTDIRFVVQTSKPANWFRQYSCVHYQPYIPYDEVPKALSGADVLVMPYDFSKDSERYIKFSMPTKVPEYMMSGVPILIYAPEDTALVNFAGATGIASIVTHNNIEGLSAAIKNLLRDDKKRLLISTNAKAVAEERFDSLKIRKNFTNTISGLWLN